MKIIFSSFLILLFPIKAQASYFLCLSEESNKYYLQFNFPIENSNIANIQYKDSLDKIQIKRVSEIVIPSKGERLSTVKSKWIEINKKNTDSYILITQGATVDKFVHIILAKKEKVIYYDTPSAYAESGCDWSSI
ncbi:hypothetical protein R6242_15305 [Iodobacter sp. CM08]|uniref:hypothetical protein n=1 Tax=Iodobacter sp. CM08 TaxID=3085902 RepID=UPI00298159E0|nr:hypothetical protein [Iodobacter sp. CM08]MDW5417934.1 hypothetical protein [Iodobacter sp. CM08]